MAPHTNGDVASSAFLQHLLSYPLINDGVATFKSNPYGQKSLELGDSAYRRFAKPVMPYFSTPYQYVSPYVRRADDLGEKTLSEVDRRFPAVQKPTGELYADAKNLVCLPLTKGLEGKDHILQTYRAECGKTVNGDQSASSSSSDDRGPAAAAAGSNLGVVLIQYPRAIVMTGLIVTGQSLVWALNLLAKAKDTAADQGREAQQQVEDKVGDHKH